MVLPVAGMNNLHKLVYLVINNYLGTIIIIKYKFIIGETFNIYTGVYTI